MVLLLLAGCASNRGATPVSGAGGGASKEARFQTGDGWTIVGDLYAPSGTSVGTVILLHQRGGSAQDWQSLCLALQKAHITALAIDQRGAGRSTNGPGPTGNDAPWPTGNDIAAAIAFLKNPKKIGLAGASYGANNALIYAAAHPRQIQAAALFSPGADYHGLDAVTPAHAYPGEVLIFHDKDDGIAGDGPQRIDQALTASRQHRLQLLDGSDHGTSLLNAKVNADTVDFFAKAFK